MGFSNEDNCCQLQGIGKLIKEKLLKGIFKVDNVLMLLEIQISSSLLPTSVNKYPASRDLFNLPRSRKIEETFARRVANKRQTFFRSQVLFGVIFFFPKSCLKVLGAAYTRVFTVFRPINVLF